MTAIQQHAPIDPRRALVEALAADLEVMKVDALRAGVLATGVVYSSEGAFFKVAHLIANVPHVEPTRLIRLLQKHGVLPRARGRA